MSSMPPSPGPGTPLTWEATDTLRVLAALSVVVAGVGYGLIEASVMLLVLGGSILPRVIAPPPWLDAAAVLTMLAAGWAAVLGLYATVAGLDLVVHAAVTAVAAMMAFELLERTGAVVPGDGRTRAGGVGAVALATSLGLALGVLWEFGEWVGHTYLDDAIQVGYDDTLGDLAAGGVGALLASLWLVRQRRRDGSHPVPRRDPRSPLAGRP